MSIKSLDHARTENIAQYAYIDLLLRRARGSMPSSSAYLCRTIACERRQWLQEHNLAVCSAHVFFKPAHAHARRTRAWTLNNGLCSFNVQHTFSVHIFDAIQRHTRFFFFLIFLLLASKLDYNSHGKINFAGIWPIKSARLTLTCRTAACSKSCAIKLKFNKMRGSRSP